MPKNTTPVGSSDDRGKEVVQEEPSSAKVGQNNNDNANDGETIRNDSKDTAAGVGSQGDNGDAGPAATTATAAGGESAGQEAEGSQDRRSAEKDEAKEKDGGDADADADAEKLWVYLDGVNPTQHGPFAQTIMLRLLRTGSAHKDMMAWSEGMAEWKAIGQVCIYNRNSEENVKGRCAEKLQCKDLLVDFERCVCSQHHHFWNGPCLPMFSPCTGASGQLLWGRIKN